MLLLNSTYKINNTLRFLITLPARIVTLKNYARVGLLFILFVAITNKGFAQQDCSVPYTVDLTASPNVNYTAPGYTPQGQCDGVSSPYNCISYKVLLNPGTDLLTISSGQLSNKDEYFIDGDGPYSVGQPACVAHNPKGFVIITFCKPGFNVIAISFKTSAGISTSPDLYLRQGCTGTMTVHGMIQSTITWTSGNPIYDSYLNKTSGDSTVTVTPPAVPPASGYVDYQATGIEQSPCNTITKNATIRVWMYPALTVSLTTSGATVCSGNPVTLTATVSGGNPGYTYLWSNGATTPSITVNTAGTYTVSVNDQLSNCGPVIQSITIAAATPVPPTVPPATICNGNSATLTATAPGGPYQWYNSLGALVSSSATYTTPTLTTGTYYYTVMTSFGGCPSTPATVTVTVLPASPAPTAPSVTVCTGSQATLTATAPGSPYQWYDSGGNLVGNSASFTAPLLPAGTYNYTVVSSVTGCPGPPTTVTVTVLPTPAAPTAAPVTICNGNPANLTATGPGGPYQWYNPSGSPVGDGSSASYTTPPLTAGTYNYTVKSSFGGCPSLPATVIVTVLPASPAPTAAPVTVCNGNPATLTATAPGGPYQWFDPSGNPVGDGSSASYTTPPLTAGTYSYKVISSVTGCSGPSTTVTITVLPTPPGPTAASVTVCTGNPATLLATAPGGPYQWYNAAGTLVSSNASYTTPVMTTAGTYNFTVMTSLGGCPSLPTAVTVTVLPTPPPPTAPPATICTGTTASLTATAPGGPYQWYDASGNLVCNNCTTYITPVLTTGTVSNTTYNYTVTTSFGGCPSLPTTVPVTVTPLPPTPTVQSQ